MPDYGWAHPCKYVFIQKSTGNYYIREESMPPLFYWLSWEEVSVPFPHHDFIQSSDTSFYVYTDIIPDPHKYALLITWNAWEDQARWNNLSHVFSGLKQAYGFIDDNIFVLSDDGVFPDSLNHNLDGLYPSNDFDGPCTKEKIGEIFEHLDSIMTNEDIFLFYATTHGDTLLDDPVDTTSLRLWDYEPFYDYELEEMVENLECSQMVFSIDACYAGGFLDELEGAHRIVQVPVPRGKFTSRKWRDFDYFTYGWATAVRGWHVKDVTRPWEQSLYRAGYHPHLDSINSDWTYKVDIDPDSINHGGNQDGFLQFGEVFNYIKNFDGQAQLYNLDYQNHGFRGDLLTLNGIEGRVDTSQYISGNFLIGRKLTLTPGVVLSDNSTYLNHCNLYLNDSSEILVQDSATLNINGPFTKFYGCVGHSFANIEGDISEDRMNFEGDTNATIHVNFNNPSKSYALEYFDFDHAAIFADCDSLSFSYTSFDNTPVEFTGSYLVLNNTNTVADSPLDFTGNFLKITAANDFDNSDMALKSGSITFEEANVFLDSDIEFSGNEINITGPNSFINSVLDLSKGNIIIDENDFTNASVSISHPFDEAAYIEITNNSFENDSTVTFNAVVTIEDYKNFQVDTNTFLYESGRGIELFYAGWDGRGMQQIAKNSIELEQPSTSLWSDVGIHSYSSNVNINNNRIKQNSYGIVGFHNSDLMVLGDSTVNSYDSTQLIGDNTRTQCLFNTASFPAEFHWNVIRDTNQYAFQYHPFIKTVEYDELMQDTTGATEWLKDPYLDVTKNCWIDSTGLDDRLIPLGAYIDSAVHCPGSGGGHLKTLDIPQSIYYQAENDILDCNYLSAQSGFKQVIAEYPENKYALASLKGLFALNPALYDTNYSILKQYCDSLALNPGDSLLGKTAEWLSIRCNIENLNYQQAINSLDSILANPGTYADSIFALIDLSEVFAEMNDSTGLKTSLITKNIEIIPGSHIEFLGKRKSWIDLLLKTSEDAGPEDIPPVNNQKERRTVSITSIQPNPAMDEFEVEYTLQMEGKVEIQILSVSGQLMQTVKLGNHVKGEYSEALYVHGFKTGTYIILLKLENFISDSQTLIILK
jgi:hypothetical protein